MSNDNQQSSSSETSIAISANDNQVEKADVAIKVSWETAQHSLLYSKGFTGAQKGSPKNISPKVPGRGSKRRRRKRRKRRRPVVRVASTSTKRKGKVRRNGQLEAGLGVRIHGKSFTHGLVIFLHVFDLLSNKTQGIECPVRHSGRPEFWLIVFIGKAMVGCSRRRCRAAL